jgi:hypothetical protein
MLQFTDLRKEVFLWVFIMTERVLDRKFTVHPDQASEISSRIQGISVLDAADASSEDGGMLPAGTSALVRVKLRDNGGGLVSLGVIRIDRDVLVDLNPGNSPVPHLDLPDETVAIGFIPDSDKRKKAAEAVELAGSNFMHDVLPGSLHALENVDRELASEFLQEKESLLKEQNISMSEVMQVQFITGIRMPTAR